MENLDLMYEVTRGKPNTGPQFDRWFRNRRFDLSVYGVREQEGEQLSVLWFRLDHRERLKSVSLFWDGQNLRAYLVDEGDADVRKNNSPMMIASLTPDLQKIISEFNAVSTEIPEELRDFVIERLTKSPLAPAPGTKSPDQKSD
ncbi:MAG TPA: hypothetical protein PLZ57_04325 [Pseudobdellovibrionaceae bacterium]|nr:hypothetical protein [Pseudobdellovibrionaceae bacterium]